jgi:hypothetical protein
MSISKPIAIASLCRVLSAAVGTSLCLTACHLGNTQVPTRVESGLLYSAGQAEFDTFFRDLYQLQTELQRAPDEERKLRSELAERLEVTAGATPQLLVDTVTNRAKQFADKKTYFRLEVDGFGAEDEADTMVQSTVSGPLDGKTKSFVENATLLARLELRHAAKLRKANKQASRLIVHAQALDPSIEPTFGAQGYSKLTDVKRNLEAAKRALPLLSLQATDQADTAEQLVRKLSVALTTDQSLPPTNEPPLIANAPKRTRGTATPPRRNGGGTPATKPKSETSSSESGDFAP